MGGYAVPAQDALDQLRQILQDARRRLREIEAVDGSQIFGTVATLKELVNGLVTATDINVSGSVTAGTTVTGNTATFAGGVNSSDVYSRDLTGSGGYHSTWTSIGGQLGWVPSSRRFKQDIETADLDWEAIEKLRVVTYRYIAAVAAHKDAAPIELGLIAEEVADLGLPWLVTYDADGQVDGINERALPVLALAVALRAGEAR
jgi:hypothetical protein